jgi:hypothetical protein
MNINFDKEQIDIPCEGCGIKTKKTIGWIKSNKQLNCTCGATINLETSQFTRELKKIEKSFLDLEKTLKKLGN